MLYGRKTLSLTLREGNRLNAFEKSVLRKTFGSKDACTHARTLLRVLPRIRSNDLKGEGKCWQACSLANALRTADWREISD